MFGFRAREFGIKKAAQRSRNGACHLKKGGAYLRPRLVTRYEFIEMESGTYRVKILCRVMKVTGSGYYSYLKKKAVREKTGENLQARQVRECFEFHRRRDGVRGGLPNS